MCLTFFFFLWCLLSYLPSIKLTIGGESQEVSGEAFCELLITSPRRPAGLGCSKTD